MNMHLDNYITDLESIDINNINVLEILQLKTILEELQKYIKGYTDLYGISFETKLKIYDDIIRANKGEIFLSDNSIVVNYLALKRIISSLLEKLHPYGLQDTLSNLNKTLKEKTGKSLYVKSTLDVLRPLNIKIDLEDFMQKLKKYRDQITDFYKMQSDECDDDFCRNYLGVDEYLKNPDIIGYVKTSPKIYKFIFKPIKKTETDVVCPTIEYGISDCQTYSSTGTAYLLAPGEFENVFKEHFPEYYL
jgi:hypothetical protein